MKGPLDVSVCGCGIGGLAIATLLARTGHRVVVYDRFEKPAPVGSGFLLQPTGLAVLRELRLLDTICAYGRTIRRFFGHEARTGKLVLDLRYDALRGGLRALSVQRSAIFDLLFVAAEGAGVAIETGHTVRDTSLAGSRRSVDFADGTQSPAFDLVIDALGQRSVLRTTRAEPLRYGALWASLDWPAEGFSDNAGEQRYRHAAKMIGVVPTGTSLACADPKAVFFWSIRRDALAAWRDAPLDAWKDEVRGLWSETAPLLDGIEDREALTFAQYRHNTLARPCAPALAHIGDSYHATSPQLGQGANMALLDAFALARGIETEPTLEAAFDSYIWARAAHVRLFQTLSWAFTPLYQSDSALLPSIRDRVLVPLCDLPLVPKLLAMTVTGLLGGPLGRLGLEAGRLPGDSLRSQTNDRGS